jgi:hypothetical protein
VRASTRLSTSFLTRVSGGQSLLVISLLSFPGECDRCSDLLSVDKLKKIVYEVYGRLEERLRERESKCNCHFLCRIVFFAEAMKN